MTTDKRITKPKLVNSSCVKTVVCVIKPGPIADVAIRKAAPVYFPAVSFLNEEGKLIFMKEWTGPENKDFYTVAREMS